MGYSGGRSADLVRRLSAAVAAREDLARKPGKAVARSWRVIEEASLRLSHENASECVHVCSCACTQAGATPAGAFCAGDVHQFISNWEWESCRRQQLLRQQRPRAAMH